ncbi:sugar-binding transcriptional regulator [Demequina sp. NBRC 110056]|uniref:sugar-binding transcriptional regulator n=1 Tax=Demequina sp. NBRC 110056 TaxID=1570345 RepID=UPI00117BEAB7|nr:sugar-binding domain-containing protein [Demequina sp. NBRC 110056]
MRDESPDARRAQIALRAAQLYYMQDQTMEAIARELGTSRSSISRLLAHARESGIVEIQVHTPDLHVGELERRVSDRHRVRAHIIPVPDVVSDVERLERVAIHAARLFSGFVDSNMVVGVAWGSTLSAISKHLPSRPTRNTSVVQMNGAGNTQSTGIEYSSEILGRFGRAYHARVQQFPVPAFFDDPATKVALWKERSIRRLLDLQARMDVAIFGIGSPFAEVPSQVYIGGYLSTADFRSLKDDKAVGDVATVFYRGDGSSDGIALNARSSGPRLSTLRRVPRRVCVASGPQKLAGVRGALAGGLVTDLVVDEALARGLIASS